MTIITKMGKIVGLGLLSLNLVYCGADVSGTGGQSITIVKASKEIVIYPPEIDSSVRGQDISLVISVADETDLSHFEIDRSTGTNNALIRVAESKNQSFADQGLPAGKYFYYVRAVYIIDGEEHTSTTTTVSGLEIRSITIGNDNNNTNKSPI